MNIFLSTQYFLVYSHLVSALRALLSQTLLNYLSVYHHRTEDLFYNSKILNSYRQAWLSKTAGNVLDQKLVWYLFYLRWVPFKSTELNSTSGKYSLPEILLVCSLSKGWCALLKWSRTLWIIYLKLYIFRGQSWKQNKIARIFFVLLDSANAFKIPDILLASRKILPFFTYLVFCFPCSSFSSSLC